MKVTREKVMEIAELVKIKLEGWEVERLQQDLANILEHFKEIDSISVDDIDPTVWSLRGSTELRDDVVQKCLSKEDIERMSGCYPKDDDNYFLLQGLFSGKH